MEVEAILKLTVKKLFASKLRKGFAPLLLLLGIVAVFILILFIVFGPEEIGNFGQLSERQKDQAISAAGEPAIPLGDSDQDGFAD